MILARERMRAIREPLEYRTISLQENPRNKALKILILSLVVSFVFVLPLFWESEVVSSEVNVGRTSIINATHHLNVSNSKMTHILLVNAYS